MHHSYYCCSIRWCRVLNEHNFVGAVVFTKPGQENIKQDLKLLPFVYFKSSFNRMRRHHLAITFNSFENPQLSQIFALQDRTNVLTVTSNNPSVLAVFNLVHYDFFLINTIANVFPHAVEVVEKLRAFFEPAGSRAGSERVVASSHAGFHLKLLIDCTTDGSVAEITIFGYFQH